MSKKASVVTEIKGDFFKLFVNPVVDD